jgi:predicted GTPase
MTVQKAARSEEQVDRKAFNCIVMGAAGRDFHDFQTFLVEHPIFRVCCFTADQIPFIDERKFPQELAGPNYDDDIPIRHERELAKLIERYAVDFVFLSYSDLSHEEVMHKASLVQAAGASFVLLGPKQTQLPARLPVISVTAVRTGAGKSPIAQALAAHLVARGLRVGVIRHPMPYGDLQKQSVQRFTTLDDLDAQECTIEEREEYEPYVERGLTIFAGVDYSKILEVAEAESDVILWDGGNNDTCFFRPDLSIVVTDALRPGHEISHYPGETGFRAADVVVINKVGGAAEGAVESIRDHARALCPGAAVVVSDLLVELDRPELVKGKHVVVVEDGPTLTHGGMSYGAGTVAAMRHGVAEIIDARSCAVGSIAQALADNPHVHRVLPALGYSVEQRRELRESILACEPDVVVDASPASLELLFDLPLPVARVNYHFEQLEGPNLFELVDRTLSKAQAS